jgi:hypothetical protein
MSQHRAARRGTASDHRSEPRPVIKSQSSSAQVGTARRSTRSTRRKLHDPACTHLDRPLVVLRCHDDFPSSRLRRGRRRRLRRRRRWRWRGGPAGHGVPSGDEPRFLGVARGHRRIGGRRRGRRRRGGLGAAFDRSLRFLCSEASTVSCDAERCSRPARLTQMSLYSAHNPTEMRTALSKQCRYLPIPLTNRTNAQAQKSQENGAASMRRQAA